MLFKAHSAAVYGIDANLIDVEVDYSGVVAEKDVFHTVGLPDAAVRESRDRVCAAVRNSGYQFPQRRITVNLAPAQSKKQGSHFDLPIAVAVLSASGQLPGGEWTRRYCFAGELALARRPEFDAKTVGRVLTDWRRGARSFRGVWQLVATEMWLRRWIDTPTSPEAV